MGYAANMVSTDHDLILRADRLPAVIEALHDAEAGMGHISWCDTLDRYDQSDPAEFVAQVFSDYGFPDAHADDGDVHLNYWGGDKVGSSYDEMMAAIAKGVDQPITTVWNGEDDSMWGIIFDGNGNFREGEVTVSVTI